MAVDYEALAKQFGGSAAPAPDAKIDYEALAKQFGGGGHRNAAGFKE
jgi:oligoribonuclease NrnB/cAMP/cGMP phosphodiesterase (DHH superfamily)